LQLSIQFSKVNSTLDVIPETEAYDNTTYKPIEDELKAIEVGLGDVMVRQRFLQQRKERQRNRKR